MKKLIKLALVYFAVLAILGGVFQSTALAASNNGITLNTSKNKISQTNAVLYATVSNSGKSAFTDGGITIMQGNTVLQQYSESVSSSYQKRSSVAMWFDLNKELGLKLSPGTSYTYEMFAYIGGKLYSASGSFTTPAGKPGAFQAYSDKAAYDSSENVTIQWAQSAGATKYGLTVVNNATNQIVFDQYVSGSSKNIGQLPVGRYRFQMAAYNSAGSSPITSMQYFEVVRNDGGSGSGGTDDGSSDTPILPLKNAKITSGFGWRKLKGKDDYHTGVDFTGSKKILAIADGTVVSASFDEIGGNFVVVLHDDGYASCYFHLDSYSVSKGDTVVQGEQIGVMGETGSGALGVHLHFEVRDNWRGMLYSSGWRDDVINPADYVPGIG